MYGNIRTLSLSFQFGLKNNGSLLYLVIIPEYLLKRMLAFEH